MEKGLESQGHSRNCQGGSREDLQRPCSILKELEAGFQMDGYPKRNCFDSVNSDSTTSLEHVQM